MSLLQFAPFSSAIDSGFWYQLTQRKLDVFKLDDSPVSIYGFYSNSTSPGLPPILNIDYSALGNGIQIPPGSIPVQGLLLNTNTLEDFKYSDKKTLLQESAQQVWATLKDGSALEDPFLLQRLFCLTFADLKKYHYYCWIAFPALLYPDSILCDRTQKLCDYFTPSQLDQFLTLYDALLPQDRGAFLIHQDGASCSVSALKHYASLEGGKVLLGFVDPSGYDKHPGWPLRNVLALAAYHWGRDRRSWEVVCLRESSRDGRRNCDHSIVLSLRMDATHPPLGCPEAVGWEKHKGKLGPRKVDMSATMDPSRLADAAVDLNLKLMRWRLSPDLQLERIKGTRCLLFGAGTLGCNVARCLMGWGVRRITLVDNSRVSFSNPVRQTLYVFENCLKGGIYKATASAEALRRIFPGVEAQGRVLSVPMPGHAIPENMVELVRSEVSQIEELVAAHDVVFLLMDTRESRWLPSLFCAATNKLVLNAALGFDTFLVMRHGLRDDGTKDGTMMKGTSLGCYFCNDVVAPGNSVQDRTLDQQCTVTRPGLSFMAAALAVELMVSILQHPKRGRAPASTLSPGESGDELSTELGIIPHQIRGHLHTFQNTLLTSRAFDKCTACSHRVMECYRKEGFDFLLKAFNDPKHLEKVTGLDELMKNISMDEILALSDDDSA